MVGWSTNSKEAGEECESLSLSNNELRLVVSGGSQTIEQMYEHRTAKA